MKLHHKLYMCIALVLLSLSVFRPALAAENEFGIGAMFGLTNFETERPGLSSDKNDDSGMSYGLLMRYTRKGDNGVFAGVQFGITVENAKYAGATLLEADFAGDRYQVSVNDESKVADPKWNADFLLRFGRDFDAFSFYGAVGASALLVETVASVRGERAIVTIADSSSDSQAAMLNINASEENAYLGWKIALGADFDISERMQFFAQVHYADYGKQSYGINGVEITAIAPDPEDGSIDASALPANLTNANFDLNLEGYGGTIGFLFTY